MKKVRKYAYFILGVNGAGKSSLRDNQLNIEPDTTIIDADQFEVVFGLNSMSAGKKAISIFRDCLNTGRNFLFEGTLSDKAMLKRIITAKNYGYIVKAYFVGLSNCDLHKARVSERVINGGHYIDPNDIERRYKRSLNNIPFLFNVVDQLKIMDNSESKHPFKLILLIIRNKVLKQYSVPPNWVSEYVIAPFNVKS